LKSVVCALRRQRCDTCLLRSNCLYPLVFETRLAVASTPDLHVVPPPHPFVIEPTDDVQTHYQKGDRFDFNLILFGTVNRQIPYFIYAFEKIGEIGIGKAINGGRGLFELEKVKSSNRILYLAKEGRLRPSPACRELTLKTEGPPDERAKCLPEKYHSKLFGKKKRAAAEKVTVEAIGNAWRIIEIS